MNFRDLRRRDGNVPSLEKMQQLLPARLLFRHFSSSSTEPPFACSKAFYLPAHGQQFAFYRGIFRIEAQLSAVIFASLNEGLPVTGIGEKIPFAGSRIAGNQQRGALKASPVCAPAQRRASSLRSRQIIWIKRAQILRTNSVAAAPYESWNATSLPPGQHVFVIFVLQMYRRNLHQEVLPVDHDMFVMGALRLPSSQR